MSGESAPPAGEGQNAGWVCHLASKRRGEEGVKENPGEFTKSSTLTVSQLVFLCFICIVAVTLKLDVEKLAFYTNKVPKLVFSNDVSVLFIFSKKHQ